MHNLALLANVRVFQAQVGRLMVLSVVVLLDIFLILIYG